MLTWHKDGTSGTPYRIFVLAVYSACKRAASSQRNNQSPCQLVFVPFESGLKWVGCSVAKEEAQAANTGHVGRLLRGRD